MSTAQRVSRGFHRLAFFLASIPLLIGGPLALYFAFEETSNLAAQHRTLVCAHKYEEKPPWEGGGVPADAFVKKGLFDDVLPPENREVSLKKLGCSASDDDTIRYGEMLKPPTFNWLASFGFTLLNGSIGPLLPVTLVLSLALYVLVRVIGWVIGGFIAS